MFKGRVIVSLFRNTFWNVIGGVEITGYYGNPVEIGIENNSLKNVYDMQSSAVLTSQCILMMTKNLFSDNTVSNVVRLQKKIETYNNS